MCDVIKRKKAQRRCIIFSTPIRRNGSATLERSTLKTVSRIVLLEMRMRRGMSYTQSAQQVYTTSRALNKSRRISWAKHIYPTNDRNFFFQSGRERMWLLRSHYGKLHPSKWPILSRGARALCPEINVSAGFESLLQAQGHACITHVAYISGCQPMLVITGLSWMAHFSAHRVLC